MSVNNMTFEQISTTLNAIKNQATGETSLAPTNSSEWVSVAQKTLAAGYDPVTSAISQVIGKTIFSIRPYNRRFAGIRGDAQKWGSITRKLTTADKPFENDARYSLTDGQSVDQWTVNKPHVLETVYTGATIFEKSLTQFKDQLDNAFHNPEEFGRYVSMTVGNASDMIEQANETLARGTIANYVAGKVTASNGVVHLLTEYNTETGKSLTSTTVYDPDNFGPFIKWVYARIATVSDLMTERSSLYQVKVTGYDINRHTPKDRQRLYILNNVKNNIAARVLADTFHDGILGDPARTETINYWQSIETPDTIKTTPVYMQADGTLTSPTDPVTVSKLFAVLIDEETLGYVPMQEWTAATPLNAKGGYYNLFWHWTTRFWNDYTEKGVIFLLD